MTHKYAIEVTHVAKKFRLYHERSHSLKQLLLLKRKNLYEDFWVLQDISFKVEPGSTVALVGGNGSGKSTMLKMIARILKPNKGSIRTNGRVSALLELGAGFQQDYTGRENVFLNGSILGLSTKETRRRFDDIVGFSELEKFIDTPVRNYSSGMYMRLAFSIAINVDPDILLIDEVLAVGDEAFQRKCFDKILSFKQQGKTILFVSHDPYAVRRLCERAVLLDRGKMAMIGSADTVLNQYRSLLSDRYSAGGSEGVDNPYYNRFGSRQAEITGVSLLNGSGEETEVIQNGEETVIQFGVKVHREINNPVFGCIIRKEEEGSLKDVYNTNTLWQNRPTGSFSAGDEFVVQFVQPMNLGAGIYYISPAVASQDGSVFYDWQDNIRSFHVSDDGTWRGVSNLRSRILIK